MEKCVKALYYKGLRENLISAWKWLCSIFFFEHVFIAIMAMDISVKKNSFFYLKYIFG